MHIQSYVSAYITERTTIGRAEIQTSRVISAYQAFVWDKRDCVIGATDTSTMDPSLRRYRRLPKRPPPLAPEVPSSASTEWVSASVSAQGKFTKKRRIEQTEFESRPVSPTPETVDFPTPGINEVEHKEEAPTSAPKGASRAVSVRAIRLW